MPKANLRHTFELIKMAISAEDLEVVTARRYPGEEFNYVTYPGVSLDEGDIRFILIRLYLEGVLRKKGSECDIDPETLHDALLAYVRLHVNGGANG